MPRPGVPCPRCRANNPAARSLCVACGVLLRPPSAPAPQRPLPWWRRLFARREQEPLTAGSRPRGKSWRRPRLAIPALVILLSVGAWLGRDHLADAFSSTRERASAPEALRPAEVRGSSEAPGHPATAAFDGFHNQYWAPAEAGAGRGEYLEADFDQPVRLRTILIVPGSSLHQDEFLAQGRPARMTLTVEDSDGDLHTEAVTLRDEPGAQTFDVEKTDVVRVRLTTDEDFGVKPDRRLAIAEVEFFGRR